MADPSVSSASLKSPLKLRKARRPEPRLTRRAVGFGGGHLAELQTLKRTLSESNINILLNPEFTSAFDGQHSTVLSQFDKRCPSRRCTTHGGQLWEPAERPCLPTSRSGRAGTGGLVVHKARVPPGRGPAERLATAASDAETVSGPPGWITRESWSCSLVTTPDQHQYAGELATAL